MDNHQILDDMIQRFEFSKQLLQTPLGTKMELPTGTMEGYKLYIDSECNMGVHRWFIPHGMEFPVHAHESIEVFFIYKGSYEVHVKDKIYTLKAGDVFKVELGEEHFVKALEDTLVITMTMPIIQGFPE